MPMVEGQGRRMPAGRRGRCPGPRKGRSNQWQAKQRRRRRSTCGAPYNLLGGTQVSRKKKARPRDADGRLPNDNEAAFFGSGKSPEARVASSITRGDRRDRIEGIQPGELGSLRIYAKLRTL